MKSSSKAVLRKIYLSQRDSLHQSERKIKSSLIIERFLSLHEFQKATICLTYASFRSEVETDLLMKDILRLGKRLCLPITDPSTKGLLICEIKGELSDLTTSSLGIREPKTRQDLLLLPSEIDIFIVPGIAFDIYGNRLGYGGGYFDRLLRNLKPRPIIALAFENQISLSLLPFEKSDIKVTKIVTEERIIDCNRVMQPLLGLKAI